MAITSKALARVKDVASLMWMSSWRGKRRRGFHPDEVPHKTSQTGKKRRKDNLILSQVYKKNVMMYSMMYDVRTEEVQRYRIF